MANLKRSSRLQPATPLLAAALACIGIAACGGSGKPSKSTSASAAATSSSTSTAAGGPGGGRFAAMRACLEKEGVKLPKRPSGSQPGGPGGAPGGGGFPGGGEGFRRRLPGGVSSEKLQAALQKCGGSSFAGRHRGFFNGSSGKKALTEFASCMREHGVSLPAPNTSGKGPVFDTKGLDVGSSKFRSADSKCRSKLPGPFAHQGGGSPPPSENGA